MKEIGKPSSVNLQKNINIYSYKRVYKIDFKMINNSIQK